MKVLVYSVFDSKASCYGQPFFCLSREVAQRAFIDTIADPNSMLGKHPEDFSLFELGSFNDENGAFDMHAAPVNLGLAAAYKLKIQPLKGLDS